VIGRPAAARGDEGIAVFLTFLFLAGVLAGIGGILAAAMLLQYARGELPCPLCLLERAAMFGISFGAVANIRTGFSWRNTGVSLLFAVLLLIIAARQSLLDITPRPGHAYIGSAVLGLHMPVWGVVIALAVVVAYALKIILLGGDARMPGARVEAFPALAVLAKALALIVVLLAVANAASVLVQCGTGECHTFGYRLFGRASP
jgi:disulfide bond formation protein DsbB